jgi:hypothetical protein
MTSGLCRCRRPRQLRPEPGRGLPTGRTLRGAYPQRREADRPASVAADEIRARDQLEDGDTLGLKVPDTLLATADELSSRTFCCAAPCRLWPLASFRGSAANGRVRGYSDR